MGNALPYKGRIILRFNKRLRLAIRRVSWCDRRSEMRCNERARLTAFGPVAMRPAALDSKKGS